jgi:two-component system, OmpR family, response regulator
MMLFDGMSAVEDLRNFLADYYCIYGYALSALSKATRHFATPELRFVVLGSAEWPRVIQALGWIRTQSDIPVIVVGGADESKCVAALEQGADDYVFEPVSPRELLARIRAVVRFHRPSAKAEETGEERVYAFAGWEYDEAMRLLTNPSGSDVRLSRNEHAMLRAFLDSPQRTLTREHLIRATRIVEDVFDRSIDVRITRLRRKLSAGGAASSLIMTERSLGYRFNVPVERRRSRATIYQAADPSTPISEDAISRDWHLDAAQGLRRRIERAAHPECAGRSRIAGVTCDDRTLRGSLASDNGWRAQGRPSKLSEEKAGSSGKRRGEQKPVFK